MVRRKALPPKFVTVHRVVTWIPALLVMLQVIVMAFSVPSKLAISEPLAGSEKATAPNPVDYTNILI